MMKLNTMIGTVLWLAAVLCLPLLADILVKMADLLALANQLGGL